MRAMKRIIVILAAAALGAASALPSAAAERHRQRPPVTVSNDLSATWVMQLDPKKAKKQRAQRRQVQAQAPAAQRRVLRRQAAQPGAVLVQPQRRVVRNQATGIFALFAPRKVRRPAYQPLPQPQAQIGQVQAAAYPVPDETPMNPQIDPMYLPQQVDYDGVGKVGDIVIDSNSKFLYLVQSGGKARRYGVGVGKEGFGWTGTEKITQKKVWPEWRPPAEMIVRERAKGRMLPTLMEGGPANPLGARALYLGDTLYRIHGTNAPWTIGTNVSSGCIRLRNEDVTDLYERVDVGTKVIVM